MSLKDTVATVSQNLSLFVTSNLRQTIVYYCLLARIKHFLSLIDFCKSFIGLSEFLNWSFYAKIVLRKSMFVVC